MPHLHSVIVSNRPETPRRNFQQSQLLSGSNFWKNPWKFKLANIHIDSTAETDQNKPTLKLKQRDDVDLRASALKGTSLQYPEPLRNSSEKMKLGSIVPQLLPEQSKRNLRNE